MTETQHRLAGLSRQERAALLDLLRRKKEKEGDPRRIERRRDAREPNATPPPLSFAQLRLWLLDRLQPGDPTYNLPTATRIRGPLYLTALSLALAAVVDRHEALRTTFAATGSGEPVQRIAPSVATELAVVDLAALPEEARETEARRLATAESRRPFDLETGPLLRALLFRLAERDHLLLLVVHHIVSDGWSLGLLVGECVALYESLAAGRTAALPELPFQYADFAVWQRGWMAGDVLQAQLAYWKEQLGDMPELRLPADHPRPERRTAAGVTLRWFLPEPVTERLAAVAREESWTLFSALLAAFKAFLGRLSGQEDFCVGTPIANRNQAGTERLIGLFVNTLALRADLSGNPTFRELLGRAGRTAMGAYAHQDLPFERLVAEVRPERSPGRNPLFQVMLSLQQVPGATASGGVDGIETEAVALDTGTARLDLSLSLSEESGGLAGAFEASLDLFSAASVERLVGHFRRLLEGAAAAPEVRLSELPLLSEAERFQLLIEWNDTRTVPTWRESVPALIARQAQRTSAAVAVERDGESLTYGELRRRAVGLARSLRALGVEPEAPVGVLLERTLDLPPALLGVWEAGGAYLPLDPGYPAARLAALVEDSGARVVLTARGLLPAGLAERGVRPLFVDEVDELAGDGPGFPDVPPDRLAYVLYTSGSAGRPKGVMVEHGPLAAVLLGLRDELRWTAADAVPCLAPSVFDISLFELLTPLLAGGRAILLGLRPTLDLPCLLGLLPRVTRLHAVPALMRRIVDEVLAQRLAAPSLRTVLVGGDAVPAALLVDLHRAFPGAEARILYGPTEGTIVCASLAVRGGEEAAFPLLGRPLPGAVLRVCDRAGNPAPIYSPGEVWIGGPGIARGYLGLPGLTAERFPEIGGERFYRTGDLARRRADGVLEFLGRADGQVKIRGVRIETGEIEAALLACPGVGGAAVVVRDEGDDRRLAAFAEPRPEAVLDPVELRSALARTLPAPMLPSWLEVVERLPLTANGKVDRRALAVRPLPNSAAGGTAAGLLPHVFPRTPLEERLAAIWRSLLGVERVGVHDSFFALGGHSLLAMRLAAAVREAFGVEVPLPALFEKPTLAHLAEMVAAALSEESEEEDAQAESTPAPMTDSRQLLAGLSREERAALFERLRRARQAEPAEAPPAEASAAAAPGEHPLSFSQERLWFLEQLFPGTSLYNIPGALRLSGALDAAVLARTLNEVVRRQAALRTIFAEVDGQPVQRVVPAISQALPLVDLAALPATAAKAESMRVAAEDAALPFDLVKGPVLRARLLRLGGREHLALFSMHHIVSDGWSMGVFFREIGALYGAFAAGRPTPLPELPLQFADFARRQRGQLQGEAPKAGLDFWHRTLAGVEVLELPVDHPRPAVRRGNGGAVRAAVGSDLSGALAAVTQKTVRGTFFMGLLAVFQALLHRLTGQGDVAVGTAVAGRTGSEVANLIGFFVNTLVLRGDLSGDPTFRDLLGRARQVTLAAFRHQEVPFEKVVEALQPERFLSHTPLFQVMLTLQITPVPKEEAAPLAGIVLEPLPVEGSTAKFDLTLAASEGPQGLFLRLEYDADLFEASTAERLLRCCETLLAGAVAAPEERLSALPVLTAAERDQLVVVRNRTAAPYPRDATVHGLFTEQAERTPEAVALLTEGRAWTYAELATAAGGLAHQLRRRGVGPEVPVAVLAERSPDLVVALLGVLMAGGFFVPLDPLHPPARRASLVARTGARLAVTQERLHPLLPAELEALCVSHPEGEGGAGRIWAREESADALAYVLFTSGSTGEPKGVAVTHRNIVRLVRGGVAGFGPGEVWAQLAPASFDASTLEIWGPLLNGGTLAILPPHQPSLAELAELLARHQVTAMWLTAGLFHQLAEEMPAGLAPLRRLLAGGDVLSPGAVRRVLTELPGLTVVNGYGPTEGTTFTCCWEMSDPAAVGETVPIGRPIANSRVYVLDANLRPVPAGVWGELCAGGDGLARGYLGRPDLTAERFAPDPFAGKWGTPGARIYRTGDLARWRGGPRDGHLEFLGRNDRQVKIRGFRVEPGEIEIALASHPEVREAAVLVRGAGADDRSLVAYVACGQPEERSPDLETDLRRHLAARLPEAMVPSAFVLLPRLPLTPNGKVDRKSLGDIAPERRSEGYVAPRTAAEETLARLWLEILGVERTGGRIGVHDSFFELGGHSLAATRLAARVRAAFGVDLPLRTLFESPTVAGLAEALAEPLKDPGRAEAPLQEALGGLSREERGALLDKLLRRKKEAAQTDRILPRPPGSQALLSFGQERLWFLDRLELGNTALNMPFSLRLRGCLHTEALRRALTAVVARHEVLRTVFREVDGRPLPVPLPPADVPLPVIDLSGLDEREAAAHALSARLARTPFDLASGPVLRACLLRLAPDLHLFSLVVHHIAADGWSLGVLTREMVPLYSAFAAGEPATLPPLPIQYADFASWQRTWLHGEVLAAQLSWWREALAGNPVPLDLPLDRPRPALQTFRGADTKLLVPAPLAGALGTLSRREGASPFMTLLAVFQALLHRLSGQNDILVGSPIAGRRHAETEELIGFFLNTLVLRGDLAGNPPFRELLRRVRANVLGAFSHQDIPFEALLAELQPERDLSRTPLFQVFFNMLNFPREDLRLPGLTIEAGGPPDVESKFDLTFYVAEVEDGISVRLVYNAGLFDRPRMEELLAQYALLLEQAAARPDVPVDDLSLVTARALAVLPPVSLPLVSTWSGPVHVRFVERARRHPERPAVADRGGVWTYAELDAASAGLAAGLSAAGIGPGDVVAVWAHRNRHLPAALLGILRAGAAFLILDPAYPAERLAAQVRQARPRAWMEVPGAGVVPEGVFPEALPRVVESLGSSIAVSSADADLPAYIAFTSGSTGTPKGIVGSHRPLSHFLEWHAATFGLGEDDRFSLLSGLAHDPLLRDVLAPLWTGGTLCIPDGEDFETPGRLAAWFERERVTVAHLTPAMAQLLAGAASRTLPELRFAFFGGDVLTAADAARMRRLAPRASLINFYGATETPQSMGWRPVEEIPAANVPVGRGIEGVQLLVLNRPGALAGIGEVGEVVIRTPYLAQGYLDDPAATAERFAADPFSGPDGGRAYRTGDLGRYLPDGDVSFAGRADAQVKVRGFRVETGEIESALARHPAIREAAVIARGDGPDRFLAAFVVPAGPPDAVPGPRELRAFLAAFLPDPMLPAAFVPLEALPLTPNRKVDRRALSRLPVEPVRAGDCGELPRTPAEEALAGIWAEVLRRDRVGVDDNFFELGGHSLLAAQVAARVRDALGVELPLRALFEAPTVAGLAARIEESWREPQAGLPMPPPLVPVDHDGVAPLSFAQERLWFLDRLEPGTALYDMPAAVRLTGRLDRAALAAALSEIVRRHASLRTTFGTVAGRPVQVIDLPSAEGLRLPLIDLTALPEPVRESEARRQIAAEAASPFDLEAGPLVRARLLRLAFEDAPEEHAVIWNTHHIVSDGWSVGVVFVRELAALYSAFSQGLPSPLPELSLQYADYAVWQRAWLQGPVLAALLGWWQDRLAGAPPALDLPTDRPRPPVPGTRGGRTFWQLPAAVIEPLRALTRSAGATPFMAFLAGFSALLHRMSGQDDVVAGTPVANRSRVEVEALIGFFVNTLALRSDLSGTPAFRTLLGRSRDTALGAYAHQDLPFEKLVEELHPQRDLSRSPVFQVMLVLQNQPGGGLALPGLTLEPIPLGAGHARFELTLDLSEGPGWIGGWFDYAADLFDASTIARLAEHLSILLAGAVAEPDRPVAELPLLSEGERSQILEWSRGGTALAGGRSVKELFAAQAARTPEAAALVSSGEEVPYAALEAWANRLAWRLRGLGVGPEARVGVALERSPEVIAALLAVLKAGGAYVPLDPSYPAERLAFMLADARPRVVLTAEGALAPELTASIETTVKTVIVQRPDDFADPGPPPELPGSGPDSPVYVIYTSGSTGTPKGVVVRDSALANFSLAMIDALGLGPGERFLQFASLSFDASAVQIFPTLLSGAALALHPDPTRLSVAELLALCEELEVTVLDLPAALWRQWVHQMADRVERGERVPAGLHTFLTGGESLSRSTLAVWASLLDRPARFFSSYGPTEATVTTALLGLSGEEVEGFLTMGAGVGAPIGRPLPGVRVALLDTRLQPVPVGVSGELMIGGAGLARGYLDRPDLTAERFVPDPAAEEPGARLYRTGDLARWRARGEGEAGLEFLGRADDQVKIRGFRIELGEVEAMLARHPAVRGAVAAAWEAETDPQRPGLTDRRLAGYVVPAAPVTGAKLRSWLRERLPEAMVPLAIVFLDAFPTTPGGKVDRRALPRPEARHTPEEREAPAAAPRNPLEERLAAVWEGLLGVDHVGIHDSFFDRGGHSLLATQLVSRVRDSFGVEMPLRDLFEAPTVAGFALRLETALREHAAAAAPPLVPAPARFDPNLELPLSFSQERLWFIDQLQPGNVAYVMPTAVRLAGPLDPAALAGALTAVASRHEALRTSFPVTGGRARQEVAPPASRLLPIADLAGLPNEARESEIRRLAREEARRPFDLARGPLLRAGLARLGAAEHVLFLTQHHIVSDGWSMGIFLREMVAFYRAFTAGGPPPELPALPVQYADFAVWQRSWLAGAALEIELAYWRRQLRGAPTALELPFDRPRPAAETFRGARRPVRVPRAVTVDLGALVHEEEATQFMVLLAAFQALLLRLTGQEDLTVGSPIAGRTRAELEGLVGFFVNTLVLRGDLSGAPTFRELVARTRRTALDAYAHQEVPFEKLVEELAPQRNLAQTPLFQVMFGLQNAPTAAVQMANDLTLRPVESYNGSARFDLTLLLMPAPATVPNVGFAGTLEYKVDLFDHVTIERWIGHWGALLAGIAADPDRRLTDLPLLAPAERHQAVIEWNDTGAGSGSGTATLHGLFLAQAAKRPEAVAVMAAGGDFTYGELARRAEVLAGALIDRGLRPGGRVGVLLERSADAAAGLLAVLQAGGTYVPLDPAYPAERLAFQMADAGAGFLLTRADLAAGLELPDGTEAVLVDNHPEARDELKELGGRTVSPTALAYIIYTSGSTGRPKGVMIEHRQAVNTLLDVNRRFGLRESDRVFAVSSLAFDLSVWDLFGALAAGATVVLPEPAAQPDPAAWSARMARCGVTVWNSAPPLLEMLVESGSPLPPALRLALLSGDWIPISLPGRVRRQVPAARVVSLGGATEGSIWSILHPIGTVDPSWRSIPYGRPMEGQRFHIAELLDAAGGPVPMGAVGELCIGGAGVAVGYLGRPELTAERFIPDPFAAEPGRRLYRTGDLGRFRPDGTIEFLGRRDTQVKIRGYRVELGEIETVLSRHPAVREAVVLALSEGGSPPGAPPGDRRLAAFVVLRSDAEAVEPEALRTFLARSLPEPMVPALLEVLESLPLTPNGKVDRRALAERPLAGLVRSGAVPYVAPRDAVEERLAAVWRGLLGVDRISVHDNFFALGGHSLLATRLVAALREAFGLEMPLRLLFERPTLADLALAVTEARVESADEDDVARLLAEIEDLSDDEAGRLLEAGEESP